MKNDTLRALVKSLYSVQKMRIETANRLELKADGTRQNKDNVILDDDSMSVMIDFLYDIKEAEEKIEKRIFALVKSHPLWKNFFEGVKGCGPTMAAVILSEVDIEKATTVSKLWQYAGMNPGNVYGTKATGSHKDGTFQAVKSTDFVRGDRLTAGYLSPYNAFLKTKLLGVLGSGFIKANSPYRKYYDNMKTRLENSSEKITGREIMWKETSPAHRHRAAIRYMLKMFLADLYAAWRALEGLEVRPLYQEEYLGHVHKGEKNERFI